MVPISSDKPSVAVLYFKNNTGDPNLDNLRTALSDLLISDLSQSKYLTILSTDRLFDVLRQLSLTDTQGFSSGDLKKVAARGNATHIIQGSYIKLGDTFRIDIDLKNMGNMKSLGSDSLRDRVRRAFFQWWMN